MSQLIIKVYFGSSVAYNEAKENPTIGTIETWCDTEKAVWYHTDEELICHAIEWCRTNREELEILDWETFDYWEQMTENA
jgi:hypothetical protein